MGAAIALGDVVGEAQDLLVVAAVPLHGDLNANIGVLVTLAVTGGMKDVGVQHRFAFVDEVHKAFHPTCAREVVFFAGALVL